MLNVQGKVTSEGQLAVKVYFGWIPLSPWHVIAIPDADLAEELHFYQNKCKEYKEVLAKANNQGSALADAYNRAYKMLQATCRICKHRLQIDQKY